MAATSFRATTVRNCIWIYETSFETSIDSRGDDGHRERDSHHARFNYADRWHDCFVYTDFWRVASLLAVFAGGELVVGKTAHFHLAYRSRCLRRVHFHAAGDSPFDSVTTRPNKSPEPIPIHRDAFVSRQVGIHAANRPWFSFRPLGCLSA